MSCTQRATANFGRVLPESNVLPREKSWRSTLSRARAPVAVLLVLASCSAPDGRGDEEAIRTRRGSALAEPSSAWTYKPAIPLPPGEEFLILFSTLRNVSSEPLEVRSVVAAGAEEVSGAAKITHVALLARQGENNLFPQGRYLTIPPVVRAKGRCRVARLSPVASYELTPGERAVVAMVIRAVDEGKARFREQRITYEQGGQRFEQIFPFEVQLEVRRGGEGLHMEKAERSCAHLARPLSSADTG